jgi:SSS family solute:Na+ symporter
VSKLVSLLVKVAAPALLIGWAAGITYGTVAAYNVVNPATHAHFGGSIAVFPFTSVPVYIGVSAFVVNAVVTVVLTLIFRAARVKDTTDGTRPSDHGADEDDATVIDFEVRAQREGNAAAA